jgi:uncharacterized coiled-coil protein SlyX
LAKAKEGMTVEERLVVLEEGLAGLEIQYELLNRGFTQLQEAVEALAKRIGDKQ